MTVQTADHRHATGSSLDCFIPLPENRSALQAVERYAGRFTRETLRPRSLPLLYLHGPPGSGKSHLANGLMDQITTGTSAKTAQAVAAVDLGRWLTQPPGADDPLRELRTCDLLVIEDVQHLHTEAATGLAGLLDHRQSRFRGTVVTASNGPAEFKRFSLRLTSRLASGLVVGLEPLALLSRRHLAERFCQERKLAVTGEVIDWLAREPTGGVRPILGDVTRLELLARLYPPPLTLSTVVAQLAPSSQPAESALDRIAEKVAAHFGVKLKNLKGKDRHRNNLWPRHIGMYLIRELTKLPLVQIGRYFGGRDHTTVMHACKKVEAALAEDVGFANELRQLRAELV